MYTELNAKEDAFRYDCMMLSLTEKLNRKRKQLEARGWKGEAVYNWLLLIAGRYLRRFAPAGTHDPDWHVGGWHIGRQFNGPMIAFDITAGKVHYDARSGAKAWKEKNRLWD